MSTDSPGLGKGTDATMIVDHNGNPFGLRHTRNALDVYMQDQTTQLVDLYMHRHIGADITVTSDTAIDDYILNVASGHTAVTGNQICLKEGVRFYQGDITSYSNTELYLGTPLDYAYTIGAQCSPTEQEMNVNASVNSIYTYHVRPNTGVKWDIVRIIFHMEGDAAMDSSLFGHLPALTNGIVLRKKDGEYYNIFNVKSNGEFAMRAYDVSYDDRAGVPQGIYGFRCRRTFGGSSKNGVVVRLDGSLDEDIQLIIRDNVSSLSAFHAIVQGHVVE